MLGDEAPAEQDDRRQDDRKDQVALLVQLISLSVWLQGTGSGPEPPQGWHLSSLRAASQPPRSAP